MLIVAVLNGWSASFRMRSSLMESLVRRELGPFPSGRVWCFHEYEILAKRALLGRHRIKQFKRYIEKHNSRENTLLAVGKSLGGRNIVRALNACERLRYARSSLLTVDPCWPDPLCWRPNRNFEVISCWQPLNRAVNVYLDTNGSDQMAGSRLDAPIADVEANIPIDIETNPTTDHFNIVQHPTVARVLRQSIEYLGG